MSKLYVFGIGGTGARVLKSLTFLLASGVECNIDAIVPIIIDRDISNKDLSRTKLLIEDYVIANKIASTKGQNRFFKTKIELLNNELCLKLKSNEQKFDDFIGKSTMSDENKALIEMLFSQKTLKLDMTEGFQGNPNIGSVVLNQFDDSDVFKEFANNFKEGDKIFIISSIFGGTGASGFPLLRKTLQTPNVKDSEGSELPNWGLVNKATIGAISVLPYFAISQYNKDNNSIINSDTFIDKTKAALSYYKTEDKKLDYLYYIADTFVSTYEHNKGGDNQKNNAHFIELASALAVLDFINHKNIDGKKQTVYKEFGIKANKKDINFNDLADETQKIIINPLSRFLLFTKYMGYTCLKRNTNGKEEIVVEKIDKYDIFNNEKKYQPYARKRFLGDFPSNYDSIKKIELIQRKFLEWLYEMENQNRSFSPFNLTSENTYDFIKGNLNILNNSNIRYKNWAIMDNELNSQIIKIDKALETEKCFIELFYRATEEIINFKN